MLTADKHSVCPLTCASLLVRWFNSPKMETRRQNCIYRSYLEAALAYEMQNTKWECTGLLGIPGLLIIDTFWLSLLNLPVVLPQIHRGNSP